MKANKSNNNNGNKCDVVQDLHDPPPSFCSSSPPFPVLGSEFCSGYVDVIGKWNNGFYCPASDESPDVFCCGSENHKYCCTKKDQVIQAQVQE